jgi:hypothetical protein
MLPASGFPIQALDGLLEPLRAGLEESGWSLAGERHGTGEGATRRRDRPARVRMADFFFHRSDLPCSVAVEGAFREGPGGVQGELVFVVEGPALSELGRASTLLERVSEAVRETFPDFPEAPLSLTLRLPSACLPPSDAHVELRVHLPLARRGFEGGAPALLPLIQESVAAFERLLERPEVAELLPPVME